MAMKVSKQAAIPAGTHEGIITECHETTKVFDPAKGPEAVVEVVIQPKWNRDGYETIPAAVVFSPVINGLSAFSRFLNRVGHEPKGDSFEPQTVEGTRVSFVATTKPDGFVVVNKDSIHKL